MLGMTFVNAYLLMKYFHGEPRSFRSFMLELCFDLLANTIDMTMAEAAAADGRSDGSSPGCSTDQSSRAPSPHPLLSVNGLHTVVSLRSVKWKGQAQVTCAICKVAKTTKCCLQCSQSDCVVGLCTKEACLLTHKKYPGNSRKSVPRGQKRKRTVQQDQ